ncbi:MAG TPA: carbohydrate-binding family 9-like protein [Armatimonadota bacterium]|nr:carbohydrate-binding family 9-like protein [Armatimonadota bacterium]
MAQSARCLLLVLAVHRVASAADPPVYPCYQVPVPPTMDGIIDGDVAWARIPMATGFHKLGDGYAEVKQTSVQACRDAEALYVGITCDEPDVAQMARHVRDGGPTWEDDGVEVFLQPIEGGKVTQFVVTAGAAKGGFVGAPDFRKYQAVAHADANGYSLEIRIPFSLLGARPEAGDRWRGNFCRNTVTTISGGTKFTCWAPLQAQFNEPEHFATLVMEGPAPDLAAARNATEAINAAYRAHLTRQLHAIAGLGPEHLHVFSEAAGDPQYAGKALELARRWRKLRRADNAAARATLATLRQSLREAVVLAQQSSELKYRYLIDQALAE